MKDKYEISLWEDYPDTTSNEVPFLNERKLCVIGSDTMISNIRATEPQMINNVNGTNTFSFKMRHTYIDEITGEKIQNPFLSLLVNERKVKVFWKNKWYDMLIKNLDEDSTGKVITYTCEDIFITELSKNGYNLEFSGDLQNNTGTAAELIEEVLNGSGWQFDNEHSTKIIQKTEESVYEATVTNSFTATIQSPDNSSQVNILANKKILIFYSSIAGILTGYNQIDFLYSADAYETEENNNLVLNGNCYRKNLYTIISSGIIIFKENQNDNELFRINTSNGVSITYRANRLVNTQLTKYDSLLERYVNVYTDTTQSNKRVYGYSTTEYSDPLSIVNLIVNSSNFKSTEGWIVASGGGSLSYSVYPPFENTTAIDSYSTISWLRVPEGYIYNNAFSSNKQYLTPSQGDIKRGELSGFKIGDQYIFRVKYKRDRQSSYIVSSDAITPLITTFNLNTYAPTSTNYFNVSSGSANGEWREYTLTCTKACPADIIDTLGLFLNVSTYEYIADIQFFKYAEGITSYQDTTKHRINPGEINLQSVEKTVYKYYNIDHNEVTSPEALTFLWSGEALPNRFIPVMTNFEKLSTIEAKESNRFNILQSIAESFKCWIRFIINHDNSGKMILDENGLPEKYIVLVEELGEDLGWSFEYGIDLRSIRRQVISSELTTKIIVLPNDNEFGTNGFCSIARSNLNYTRENFILNLDYYIDQGLLDKNTVNRDLYSTSNNYIGYYYNLNKYNREYDEITNLLLQKQIEFTKQQAQLTVLTGQQKAVQEQLGNYKADVMALACVSTWTAAQSYAQSHANNIKVQSLMNAIGQITNTININRTKITDLESSIAELKNYISTKESRQKQLTDLISDIHERFFKKYSRYIQEGTWQDNNYIDDNKYYLDAVDVAYTSSRPQLQYDINVMRLTVLDDFSSKIFDVGDICYIQDREFFGYGTDGITPYKLKIIISEITSYFDEPEKDIIKVQNYKTQFDDLFQRITATTQSLQYAQGGYERAAETIKPDKTLSFDLLQDTFDYNENLVLNASNQQVTWDSTGITITDNNDTAQKVRLMAGGLFISNDGGVTWKNAVRGDGISADVLTAGRVNTSEIFVYDGAHPSFRWDSSGINAYFTDTNDVTNFGKFVRFDRFGLYGYSGQNDFQPTTENSIWNDSSVKFGLTWKGFFLRGTSGNANLEISDNGTGITFTMKNQINNNSLEISTTNDILLKTGNINRVQIGRLDPSSSTSEYGIWVRDANGFSIFNVSSSGTNSVGGWTLTKDSFYHIGTIDNVTSEIGLYSNGKRATIQNNTGDYYILAGSNFGVKLDGTMYCSAGKIGGWAIDSTTLTGGNITINSNGTINCTISNTLKWKLDNSGQAIFNNIQADGGTIAGWHITPDSIYLTDGAGNIRTSLNSGWDNTYNVSKYTIVTNSISAGGGSIGGWGIGASNINSGGIILDSSVPAITIGGATLTGAPSGLNINGALAVSGTFSANGGNTFLGDGTLRLGNTVLDETTLGKLISVANNYSTHIHGYYEGTTQKHTGYPYN